jgi:enoyl-CoA hydratase/carnithine racemase
MTMLHEVYGAKTAMDLGLVTEVVPADQLDARTLELAIQLAEKAPLAVRLAKAMMIKGLTTSLEHSLHDAQLAVMVANESEDVREGVKAFFEKRKPDFKGR